MKKKKGKKAKRLFYDVLIVILLGAIIYTGTRLYSYYKKTKVSNEKMDSVRDLLGTGNLKDEADIIGKIDDLIKKNLGDEGNDELYKKYKYYPKDLEVLTTANKDCIGWITINDTVIDYPVMQRKDDNEYYLHKDFYGGYDFAGMIFADNRCDVENDDAILLYGHNMNNGTMFATLKKYRDEDFLKSHQYFMFDTIYGTRIYKVFAAFNGTIYEEDDTENFHYYDFIGKIEEERFDAAMKEVERLSSVFTEKPKYGSKLLTMSTCRGDDDTQRIVVMAYMIE